MLYKYQQKAEGNIMVQESDHGAIVSVVIGLGSKFIYQ